MAPFTHTKPATTTTSKRLALSYVFDWIVIIVIALVSVGFLKKSPNHRPFSPVDPDISFPYVEREKVSSGLLVVISLIIPAVITALIALIFTPGPTTSRDIPKYTIWRKKLWEWNTAWMGLGLGLALTYFFTEGLKDLIGKPRPDLLSRCNLDPATVQQYALGGYGGKLPLWNALVSYTACNQPDVSKLNDGFASFPSGHAAHSWAGMFYLALYLCSKFAITIPYLLPSTHEAYSTSAALTPPSYELKGLKNSLQNAKADDFPPQDSSRLVLHEQAAAPPTYLLILPLIPVSLATYVASTRFSDFRHHGFDIIFGSLMGMFLSWISFRIYHPPIRRGAGWSWGPRSASRAWGIGIGTLGYVQDEDRESKKQDLEAATGSRSPRLLSSSHS